MIDMFYSGFFAGVAFTLLSINVLRFTGVIK